MLNYKTFFKLRKESKDTKPHMPFQTYLLEPRLLLFPKQNALISLFIRTAWINSAQKGPLERMLNIKRVHFPKKNPSPIRPSQYQPRFSRAFLWWGWQRAELPKQLLNLGLFLTRHLFLPIRTFHKASGVERKIALAKPLQLGTSVCQALCQVGYRHPCMRRQRC